MASGLIAAVSPQLVSIHSRLYYSSDSAAFDQVAARILTQGHDPYSSSLSSAALLLKTPGDFWTYMVTGAHVTNVSYPAGSFLIYALPYALGFHHEIVDWVDLFAWVASAIILFFVLPRYLCWLAALTAMTGFYLGLFSGGGTDALFIPFAMFAVWRWDRYGLRAQAGIARWIGPLALGVACSIKQTPWFCVPFLVAGVYIETRRSGRAPLPVAGRYVATVLAVFIGVNLPFVIWDPSAWWSGILTPMTQPLVADGQGLVSLALHGLTGGVHLQLLTDSSALALLAVLAAFVAWYDHLKRVWLLVLPVTFFFSPRSFSSYLLDLFPVALVALITVAPASPSVSRRGWGRFQVPRFVAAAIAIASIVAAALSFAGAPLGLTFRHASIGPSQRHLYSVTVEVTNRTGTTEVPHFMVNLGTPHPTGFWAAAHHRPVVIGPHDSVTVTLYPPTPMYLPSQSSDYVVDAYTADSDSLSTSSDIWHNYSSQVSRQGTGDG